MSIEKEKATPTETLEISQEKSPYKKSFLARVKEIAKDPDAKEGFKATGRLFLNLGISAADLIPVVGEAVGWTADALKFVPKLDLTPDVSKTVAIGSEALEFMGAGAVPTHAIETVFQAAADQKAGKFEAASDAVAYLITGKPEYSSDLAKNKPKLDKAAAEFA